jgi:alanyl-tRNA synthetase
MACGKRALERLHKLCLQNKQVSQILSARPLETGAAAQQMKDALAGEKYRAAGLESKVFENIAATYAGQKAAFCFEENLEPAGVRQLAEKIAKGAELSGVFSQKDGKYNLCLAGNSEEVKALGAALSQTLGARGGGKPGFWQGSVTATQEQIQALLPKNG